MEKFDYMDDSFWRVRLGSSASAPVGVKEKIFDKQITFVVKLKHHDPKIGGTVYRKKVPEWAKDIETGILEKDDRVDRWFIDEENRECVEKMRKQGKRH